MKPKILQNPLLEPSWGLLEPSWGLLGASWAPLGPIFKKTHFFGPQLGRQNPAKIAKKRRKKRTCFEIRFLSNFHRFCIDFGLSKPSFLTQIWLQNEKRLFCKNCAPVQAGARISRFRGVQNQQRIAKKSIQQ